jgi:hypothetical protein
VVELSASALDSDPSESVIDLDRMLAPRSSHPRHRHGPGLAGFEGRPPTVFRRILSRSALGLAALTGGFVVVAAGLTPGGVPSLEERVTGVGDSLRGPPRVPHEGSSQHTSLYLRPPPREVVPPAGLCALSGSSRVLSTRATLGPGLDVNAIAGGFGVGFASSTDEALAVRLDGSQLRIADRVRVRSPSVVRHVAVDGGHSEEEGIDLRIDADDARTVASEGTAPAFRVAVNGGWIQALRGGAHGKALWPVPGSKGDAPAAKVAATATAKASAAAGVWASANATLGVSAGGGSKAKATAQPKGDLGGGRVHDGFMRLGDSAARKPAPAASTSAPAPDVRVAGREEGGAVVALRRPSALWLGLVDAHFTPEGPLLALTRPGAVIGMPSVAQAGTGGAVAWAERPAGDRDWIIMVASFMGGDDRSRPAPVLRPVGNGMSPSIAMLPGGELLLAYAVGTSGSHRVVVVRLGRDLEPRGEPVFVSPDELNAGQPAAAVGADGRGLVAFFGAEHGHSASVLATPFACAPPL